MNKSKDGSKITLGMIKGKGINTSVPSISIRFNANAEEIEELYQSEEESVDKFDNEKTKSAGVSDPDSSPLRYLPRLGKRSTSIDASLLPQDLSSPADRWKFFTEIKGKITKGVEEIKCRNQETESSLKKMKNTKDKDNSSLSDSDDLSESSISKTCGIVSTTEGVEMSSDDDTPSIDDDKSAPKFQSPIQNGTKHHRYRVIRKKKPFREGKISIEKLADLYEITTGTKPNLCLHKITSTETVEVESGVEAFEDVNPQQTSHCDAGSTKSDVTGVNGEEMISDLVSGIVNMELDDENVINVTPVPGEVLRDAELSDKTPRTYLAPQGFVDLRTSSSYDSLFDKFFCFRYLIVVIGIVTLQVYSGIPSFITSFFVGVLCTLLFNYFFYHLDIGPTVSSHSSVVLTEKPVIEIPAVKEYRPIVKIEGWMNEYPEVYNPRTYHIARTQSVYIKLQGNLLRISHTKTKIPKRALWNEAEYKNVVFTGHRVYNLLGANVNLAPIGLNKRRRWSKKYPICITFNTDTNDSINLDFDNTSSKNKKDSELSASQKKSKKKSNDIETQIFSKLTEEELLNADEVSIDSSIFKGVENDDDEDSIKEDDDELDDDSLCDWSTFLAQDSPHGTQIYLFGRTDREKEEWFRNFRCSSRKGFDSKDIDNSDSFAQISTSDSYNATVAYEQDYVKFMNQFQKLSKQINNIQDCSHGTNLLWINAILSRILFDFTHDDSFTYKVQERIQRKLSTIKLPQFVEQLSVSEVYLGNSPPLIDAVRDPQLDHRGLWVDLDIHYEGNVSLKLQTKLNLMRIKQNSSIGTIDVNESLMSEKWQYSDIDDTAESSTDEEVYSPPVIGKSSETSASKANPSHGKKFIKMVDKITESKLFQAATENRYIKKAMEGVSNTDLCLKVELKGLTGTLVLNIPPPPSDRMWIGFRPLPKLILSAQPIVGDRNISFIRHLSNWIEKKLTLEFQKLLVIPNMEDIVIPVMMSKLPT